jgi:hypothetical protein
MSGGAQRERIVMVRMSVWLVVGGKTGARGRAVGVESKNKRLYTDERRRGRVGGRMRVRRGEEKRRYSMRKSGRRRGREKKRPGCIGVPQQSPVNLLLLSVFYLIFYSIVAQPSPANLLLSVAAAVLFLSPLTSCWPHSFSLFPSLIPTRPPCVVPLLSASL